MHVKSVNLNVSGHVALKKKSTEYQIKKAITTIRLMVTFYVKHIIIFSVCIPIKSVFIIIQVNNYMYFYILYNIFRYVRLFKHKYINQIKNGLE